MTGDAVLVLAALVLAHLVADFVLQSDAMATAKFGDGPAAWRALGIHVAIVGGVLLPVLLGLGVSALAYTALTVLSHFAIDRLKVVMTRRAEPRSANGSASPEEAATGPALDRQWTAVPGALFALDQVAHVCLIFGLWFIFLAGTAPTGLAVELGDLLAGSDPDGLHRFVVATLVLASLTLVNVRAAPIFVATLVRPPPLPAEGTSPSPARVGAVIGILERLLICALVLAGAVGTIGLVIAAKTLARFKQLDDREFAEYYLLGTLASVTVAVITSLVAQQALAHL